MTVNTQAFMTFLKYAEDHEIEVLAKMHPQKTQVKGFNLAMTLYKQNRVNDNKHHRIVKRALSLMSENKDAMAIVDVFIERANADLSEATQANGEAAVETKHNVKTQDNEGFFKRVVFMDGTILKAYHKIIQPSELENYTVSDSNRRNKKALTAASVADILPTARIKGITEEIYTYIDTDNENQPVIAEGSRRGLTARILKIEVPSWEFKETLTEAQVAELSRDSDLSKRKHSLRENALALVAVCTQNGFSSTSELLKYYNVANTNTNRTAYRRILNAATISESLLALFKDYEALSLRRFNELESIQKSTFSDELKNKIRLLRRDLNINEVQTLIEPSVRERVESLDSHFVDLLSPMNIARRLADTVVTAADTKEELISRDTLKEAILEHNKPKCEYDTKGRQVKTRRILTELMLTHLEFTDETDTGGVIEAAPLRNCIDEFLSLYDRDITNIIAAYNDDVFKIVKRVMPLPVAKKPATSDEKPVETVFKNDVCEITLSEVTDKKGKTEIFFSLTGLTEEQKKEFTELAAKHFKDKFAILEANQ